MSDKKEVVTTQQVDEFYDKLKLQLEEGHNFPEDYTFKFILKNDNPKLTDIYQVFDKTKYTFSSRESKGGKYIGCTIVAFVLDADQVIRLYKETAKVDGVIML